MSQQLLLHEPADVYHAAAKHRLTSHQLAVLLYRVRVPDTACAQSSDEAGGNG